HSSRRMWVSFVALTAMAVTFFFLSEGPARSRILASIGKDSAPSQNPSLIGSRDFRISIFLDSLDMVEDFPLTGIGLGNYAWIYPFYSRLSLLDRVAIHPESDWLLLATEAGPATLLVLTVCLGLLLRALFRHRQSSSGWPLRWGIVVAALAAVLHGLVDVPLHRTGLGWWVLVLAGMGFAGNSGPQPTGGDRFLRWVFAPAGLLVLLLGAGLIRAQWFGGAPSPPFVAKAAQARIVSLSADGDFAGAEALARETLEVLPMARGFFFQLGILRFSSDATIAEVEALFAVERNLDPYRPQIPERQGEVWQNTDPLRTAELWDESISRIENIRRAGSSPERPVWGAYQQMLTRAGKNMALLNALGLIARRGRTFRLLWLENPAIDRVYVEMAAADASFLDALDEKEKRLFLKILWTKTDSKTIDAFLSDRPDWETAALPTRLRRWVSSGDHAKAIRSVSERYGIDLAFPSPPADASPAQGDFATAAGVFLQRGNAVTARRILAEAAASGEHEAIRLQAALAMREGNFPEAWNRLEAFLKATGRGDLP
ncbi:MAG: O-antigen ligase family protein, partial [Verrucomicrobiota bacterium]